MSSSLSRVAGVVTIAVSLAGCNGSAGSAIAPASTRSTLVARNAVAARHADPSASWVLRTAASSSALLYVSDVGTNDVYVYSYPGGTLVGTLTGFREPQGECSDAKGDVWIVDTQRSQVVEYAHGGKNPISTVTDAGEYPAGCAVNARGDLAVTNIVTTGGGAGSVAWYAGAKGKPKLIGSPSFQEAYFAGFDRDGNLFVDGWPSNFAQAIVGEIKRGSATLVAIPLVGATIEYPGGVQVDGGTVNVGDQIADVVFQIGENGTVVGNTPLDGASDCVQGTIVRNAFVCPDSGNAAVEFFRYPAGGVPTRALNGFSEPTGSAISE